MKWSEVAQLCPTLCDSMGCSLSDSSVHGIFQARVLQWIAISFSRGSSRPRNWTRVSHIAGRRFTVWATRERLTHLLFLSTQLGIPWWLHQFRDCLQCRRPRFDPWVGKIPWRREWQSNPVFLPGKSHGQRSLADYSPWVVKSGTRLSNLHFHFFQAKDNETS